MTKREETLASRSHLVEVDLLRGGIRLPIEGAPSEHPYYALVSRAEERPRARYVPIPLRQALPSVPIPLEGEEETSLALQAILDEVYDAYHYELDLDYGAEPAPPLLGDDRAWADDLLRRSGQRP